ncbi:MAG: hypothetical protein AAF604_10230 [Acidobacteriota bacterium]
MARHLRWIFVAAACFGALALGAQAVTPQNQTSQDSPPSYAEVMARVAVIHAPGTGVDPENLDLEALKVAIDPQTGKVRPVAPEESRRLGTKERAMLSRSAVGLSSVKRADGSVSLDLQGRFLSLSTARVEADGGIHGLCVDSLQEAHDHLEGQEVSDVE